MKCTPLEISLVYFEMVVNNDNNSNDSNNKRKNLIQSSICNVRIRKITISKCCHI